MAGVRPRFRDPGSGPGRKHRAHLPVRHGPVDARLANAYREDPERDPGVGVPLMEDVSGDAFRIRDNGPQRPIWVSDVLARRADLAPHLRSCSVRTNYEVERARLPVREVEPPAAGSM